MRKRRISESESEECRIQRVKNENESEEEEEKNAERGKGKQRGKKRKKGKKKEKREKGKLSGDSSTVPGDMARPINTQVCIVQLQLCATRTHKHTLSNCVPREHTKTHFVQL